MKCHCNQIFVNNRQPLLLKPVGKDYLWGGSRLNDDFNLQLPFSPLAEAWVCSTHKDGVSTVSGTDEKLTDLLNKHPEWLGTHSLATTHGKPELPILIKLIDAKNNLSIQVHPDDEYAIKNEHDLGKTEMWYVLDAKPNTSLVYGFNQDITKEAIKSALKDGCICSYLNNVSVHKNDLFFIEAGTVHGIGAGCLIAEIQEASNVTYRLYDYDRIDKHGQKRQLHIEKALEVVNIKSSFSPRQPMRTLKYKSGCASELLARCRYFQVERIILNTEVERNLVDFQTDGNSFHALLCVDGCGSISNEETLMNFFKGDCIFIPSDSKVLKLHGRAQILNVFC